MAVIKHLAPGVVKRIAAGEVIERPASVVKELVENALDAEAKTIRVSVLGGGLELIRVVDDGHGMSVEDLKLALLPHTTSKLLQLDDLERLQSYGFRGEALASIATIAEVSLASRPTRQPRGYQLQAHGQSVSVPQPFGMVEGTQVSVADLFKTIPARKKFLEQSQREVKQISQIIIDHALINFDVSFILEHNNRTIMHFPATQSLAERATQIFSETFLNHSLSMRSENQILTVSGLLGAPRLAKPGNQQQHFFLNRRPITNSNLKTAVKKAYANLINPQHQPAYVLHLELNPGLFDVNVHPRKEVVNFIEETKINQLLFEAVKNQLGQPTHASSYPYAKSQSIAWRVSDSQPGFEPASRQALSPLAEILRHLSTAWTPETILADQIIQIDKTYLAFAVGDGLALVDQHAAHERILFEQYQALYQDQQARTTRVHLTEPVVSNLDPVAMQTFHEHQAVFEQLGFEIEPFDDNAIKISAVPGLLDVASASQLFQEVLSDLANQEPVRQASSQIDRTIAYLACRQAVKAGDYLSPPERLKLITKLAQTPHAGTCPHGRPTLIPVEKKELAKRFGRL